MIYMDVDTALSEVPVNAIPLTDSTDFVTLETAVAHNAAGMSLEWHFVTTGGAYTVTSVTPTTGGAYDWAHQGKGMYTIEIPASGGASINNDAEGFGYFVGSVTGVLPFRGPTICFRAAGLNNLLIDDAHSATRGLAGTALPAAAADAAGGLPISDAGGLDLDGRLDAAVSSRASQTSVNTIDDFLDTEIAAILAAVDTEIAAILADTNELQTDWVDGGRLDLILDARASQTSVDDLPTNAELATSQAAADDATLAAIAGLNNLSSAQAQTAAAAALSAYDPPTHAELTTALAAADDAVLAAIAALNNLSAAGVNAEVLDALATDTYAEPGQGNPGATISLAAKINYLYKWARNKVTQTATTRSHYNDDGTTVDQKSTVSDDNTTYVRGEIVTGP